MQGLIEASDKDPNKNDRLVENRDSTAAFSSCCLRSSAVFQSAVAIADADSTEPADNGGYVCLSRFLPGLAGEMFLVSNGALARHESLD